MASSSLPEKPTSARFLEATSRRREPNFSSSVFPEIKIDIDQKQQFLEVFLTRNESPVQLHERSQLRRHYPSLKVKILK